MKITATIQARMGSTRLPGKVLMTVGTEPVLARVVHRLRRAALIDGIIVATSDRPAGDAIVRECNRLQVACFRGSGNGGLLRYLQPAPWGGAEAIVRISSASPCIHAE